MRRQNGGLDGVAQAPDGPLPLLFPASLAVIVIFAALVGGGAEPWTHAMAFTGALSMTLALAAGAAPRLAFGRVVADNLAPGAAALAFLAWTGVTALAVAPAFLPLAHPLSATFGWSPPAMSISPADTLLALIAAFGPIAAFVVGAFAGAEERTRAWSVRIAIGGALLFSIVALEQFVAGAQARLNAGLSSPNIAAPVFGACGLLSVAVVIRAGRRVAREARQLPGPLLWLQGLVSAPFSAASGLLCIACAFLTGSRAGVAAVALGFGVLFGMLALAPRPGETSAWRTFGLWAALVGVSAFVGMGASQAGALLAPGDTAFSGRQLLAETHWGAFLERPLFGHGLGTYDQLNLMMMTPDNHRTLVQAGAAHNVYIQLLEESGLIGALLLTFALGLPLLRAAANLTAGAPGREWSSAAIAIAVIFLTHSMFDYTLQAPANAALFAFTLGLLCQPARRWR